MNIEMIARISTVILTGFIALLPPFYSSHSIFTNKTQKAIDNLKSQDEEIDGLEFGHLQATDDGFNELVSSIEMVRGDLQNPEKLTIAYGDLSNLSDYFGMELRGISPNAICFATYETDEKEILLFDQFQREKIRRLEPLFAWVEFAASKRSQYILTGATVLWTTLSIFLVF